VLKLSRCAASLCVVRSSSRLSKAPFCCPSCALRTIHSPVGILLIKWVRSPTQEPTRTSSSSREPRRTPPRCGSDSARVCRAAHQQAQRALTCFEDGGGRDAGGVGAAAGVAIAIARHGHKALHTHTGLHDQLPTSPAAALVDAVPTNRRELTTLCFHCNFFSPCASAVRQTPASVNRHQLSNCVREARRWP
jgi:hypothetical protein